MSEIIAPRQLYIHIYKGEQELCMMHADQSFSVVVYGNNLLHKDFESLECWGYKTHLHYWFANGCRWRHEVERGLPKRALPQCIHMARFNRKCQQMMSHKCIALPHHLIALYDSANK